MQGRRQSGLCAFLQRSLVMTLVQFSHQRNGSGGPEDEAVEADCGPSEGTGPSSSQGQKRETESQS